MTKFENFSFKFAQISGFNGCRSPQVFIECIKLFNFNDFIEYLIFSNKKKMASTHSD
jgi:hypothetical protein